MSAPHTPDPDEYRPEPVPAAEEYAPQALLEDPAREADPADVAEQLAEVPTGDDERPDDDDADEI